MEEVNIDEIYIHINTGRAYEILACENYKLKFNGVWYDAVLYRGAGPGENEIWSRTKEDFMKKFKKYIGI